MTDIRGIRHIKTVQGLTSCTYWEAVLKLHNFSKEHNSKMLRTDCAVSLAVVFERDVKEVILDIARGTP